MKVLTCIAPGKLAFCDYPIPSPQEGFTLLAMKRVGICGTDFHAYEGTQPYFAYPRILGHELGAEIVQTSCPGFTAGEAVTVIPYLHCGECIACINGKTNCCESLNVMGVHSDGGMREFISVPDRLLVKSQGLSFDELALVEPLAIAAHGIARAEIKVGEFVLVSGAGPIGTGLMEFARIKSARVIALEVNEQRLAFCRNVLKVPYTLNPLKEDIMDRLREITGNAMPTVIIDATGNHNAINNAFNYLAHGGRYVLVGLQKQNLAFSHPEFHKRESTLMSSRNATRKDFDGVISSMKTGDIHFQSFITHKTAFSKLPEVLESWFLPDTNVIKGMVTFACIRAPDTAS